MNTHTHTHTLKHTHTHITHITPILTIYLSLSINDSYAHKVPELNIVACQFHRAWVLFPNRHSRIGDAENFERNPPDLHI
jgi:hypothetical protein